MVHRTAWKSRKVIIASRSDTRTHWPTPVRCPLVQRDHDPDRQLVAGGRVGHGDSGAHRALARQPGDAHQPAGALDDLVDGALLAAGPSCPYPEMLP